MFQPVGTDRHAAQSDSFKPDQWFEAAQSFVCDPSVRKVQCRECRELGAMPKPVVADLRGGQTERNEIGEFPDIRQLAKQLQIFVPHVGRLELFIIFRFPIKSHVSDLAGLVTQASTHRP